MRPIVLNFQPIKIPIVMQTGRAGKRVKKKHIKKDDKRVRVNRAELTVPKKYISVRETRRRGGASGVAV